MDNPYYSCKLVPHPHISGESRLTAALRIEHSYCSCKQLYSISGPVFATEYNGYPGDATDYGAGGLYDEDGEVAENAPRGFIQEAGGVKAPAAKL